MNYYIRILCDDGEYFDWQGEGQDLEDAKAIAWADALYLQRKPVEVTTWEQNDV